jgi:hypothetical protein
MKHRPHASPCLLGKIHQDKKLRLDKNIPVGRSDSATTFFRRGPLNVPGGRNRRAVSSH